MDEARRQRAGVGAEVTVCLRARRSAGSATIRAVIEMNGFRHAEA